MKITHPNAIFGTIHPLKTYRLVQFKKSRNYHLVQLGIVIH